MATENKDELSEPLHGSQSISLATGGSSLQLMELVDTLLKNETLNFPLTHCF